MSNKKTIKYEFLKHLDAVLLPVFIYDHELIDELRAYEVAGLIKAKLPQSYHLKNQSARQPAEVLEVTRHGRQAIKLAFKLSREH